MQVHEQVTLELNEMKKVGIRVTDKALAYPNEHQAKMQEFRANGMKISEIARLVVNLTDMVDFPPSTSTEEITLKTGAEVYEKVIHELTVMKSVGMRVTDKALAYPKANQEEMKELRGNGMKISEIADMVIELTDMA